MRFRKILFWQFVFNSETAGKNYNRTMHIVTLCSWRSPGSLPLELAGGSTSCPMNRLAWVIPLPHDSSYAA
jgi:hypothetical protein